jgi:hypothetical protein
LEWWKKIIQAVKKEESLREAKSIIIPSVANKTLIC